MKQKTKDHVEFGYFFSKDRINTWKNSPLQKLMPDAWGRGGNNGKDIYKEDGCLLLYLFVLMLLSVTRG